MPTITVKKPNIITFAYRQKKDDKDYGTCLWARFNLDLENYSMAIESDCGNYSYQWTATPDTESFLHLCCRFDKGYLLEKFSNRSVINSGETWKAIFEHIKEYEADISSDDLDNLKDVCFQYTLGFSELYIALEHTIKELRLSDLFDFETLGACIETDYPTNAKTIINIFFLYIVPEIRKYEEVKG